MTKTRYVFKVWRNAQSLGYVGTHIRRTEGRNTGASLVESHWADVPLGAHISQLLQYNGSCQGSIGQPAKIELVALHN